MWVDGQLHARLLHPGKDRVPHCKAGSVGPEVGPLEVQNISPPIGIRSPDRLDRSESKP
jgi:hypothetical protein